MPKTLHSPCQTCEMAEILTFGGSPAGAGQGSLRKIGKISQTLGSIFTRSSSPANLTGFSLPKAVPS
ncbi:MAG: hypothetical protein V2I44_07985 [Erythrobacter sp.]|uniref:hypothetical protein n=2 Tax=Erythrobacter litoralis TaxID=39960 RepID=UPI0012378B09|nr:hypothetical protein [Erythrobacter litoralis]MEE4338624.1 hypothetical protein [Erythrobacter sp.]